MSKPTCKLIGRDGNIFEVMGRASRALKSAGMRDEAEAMMNRVTSAKSYNEALSIILEYVEEE